MQLIDKLNEFIVTPDRITASRSRSAFYPSEASAISRTTGEVLGKCLRAVWYDWTNTPASNPIDARGWWTFQCGNLIESAYIENVKKLGIWAGDHVKFFDSIYNISGEADLFVFADSGIVPTEIIGIELKTAYGYGFQKNIKMQPKPENVMQVMLYLMNFPDIKEWRIVYHSRDTMENVEYIITMEKDDTGHYAVINRSLPIKTFYVEDIYKRYETLGSHLVKNEPPPKDFVYCFTPEQTADRAGKGTISRSKYSAIKNGKVTDSDWQCLYCKHLDTCYAEKRAGIKMGINGVEEVE